MSETLQAVIVPVTPFQQNCSVIWNRQNGRGALIDPGGDIDRLVEVLEEHEVTLEKILLTHGHLDHASATATLAERFDVPVEGPHRDDDFLLQSLPKQGEKYGFTWARACTPDRWLENGDQVSVADMVFDVVHCPGHTPGHVVFFHEPSRLAFVGDVLFHGSIGRTDLPRGNHMDLINSIRERLWPLGEDVRFVPGHGGMSTFGNERKTNPYVSDFVEY